MLDKIGRTSFLPLLSTHGRSLSSENPILVSNFLTSMKEFLLLSALLLNYWCLSAQNINFEAHQMGMTMDRMGQTNLVDVDNDGDLDWVFGRRGAMFWFEYIASKNWVLHTLGKGAKTDVGVIALDVNQDQWMDFVVGDSWYENTGNPTFENFILHKKNMIVSHDNIVADINGDGIKDVVSLSNNPDHPVLAWYQMPKNVAENWDYVKIGQGIHGGISPRGYGDMDGDGDMDIVRGNSWFENLNGDGLKWDEHKLLVPKGGNRPGKPGLALKTWCMDMDKDGDLDIVEAEADTSDGRIFWFENTLNGSKFEYHPVSDDTTRQDFHTLILADFDNDGDVDIVSGGGPFTTTTPKLFLWENLDGKGLDWKEHLILEGHSIHEASAADVDQDGDVDICSKPWRSGLHLFLENKLIDK